MNVLPDPPALAVEQNPAAVPRSPDTALDRVCLAAPLLLSALVVVLDATASWRIPLQRVLPWVYFPALAAAALWLLAALRTPWPRGRFVLFVILAALAVYLPIAGLFGSWRPDPVHGISMGFDDWCYQSLGDYLLNHPRGQVAGMSMLDEFGAHLQDSRFSTPGLLELIGSGAPFKDPPMSHFGLSVLCLAVHFCSLLYLCRPLFDSLLAALFAAFLATAGGWMSDALELANYDNLVFLALAPALVGVLARLAARPAEGGGGGGGGGGSSFPLAQALAGGLLGAALLETFPEGVPILAVLLVPLALALGWRGVRAPRLGAALLLLLGFACLLALPYLPVFWKFLLHQIEWAAASTTTGAAGNFPGLLDGRRLPAFFALGEEWTGALAPAWHYVLPAVLLALAVTGAWSWWHRPCLRWLPWTALPLAALLFWQNVWKHYDYGTYKVLFCAAWWLYPAAVAGAAALGRAVRLPAGALGWLLALLCVAVGWQKAEARARRGPLATGFMEPLRELTHLRFVTQGQPLLLDFGGFDYIWAVYYLRRESITTFQQREALAMPHLVPFLAQAAAPPPQAARFVLVKGKRSESLWTDGSFSLLSFSSAYIAALDGPWGVESAPGIPDLIWIGTQPETFRIRSAAEGDFVLHMLDMGIGPRAVHPDHLAFEITDAAGTVHYEWHPGGPKEFPLRLHAGENVVSVRCAEPPAPAPASGDLREVMLQLRGYSVAPRQ